MGRRRWINNSWYFGLDGFLGMVLILKTFIML
jgi:hypothetical protein